MRAGSPAPLACLGPPLLLQEPGFLTASLVGLFSPVKLTRASAELLEGAGLTGAPNVGCAGAGPQAQLYSPPGLGGGGLPWPPAPRALSPLAVGLPGTRLSPCPRASPTGRLQGSFCFCHKSIYPLPSPKFQRGVHEILNKLKEMSTSEGSGNPANVPSVHLSTR